MRPNILQAAATLSDDELLARLPVLAGREREATAELVAHLAVLETRSVLYAAEGYGSLFSYCTQALLLSEDAACNRIEAARVCRRFPCILDLLVAGTLSVTAVRLLGRHLTEQNHKAVLERAAHKSRREIEVLVAGLAPRPDVPSLIRKLPSTVSVIAVPEEDPVPNAEPARPISAPPSSPRPVPRPVVEALAPERYRVQFTIGQETQEKLRRLQSLLRRRDPGRGSGSHLRPGHQPATGERRTEEAGQGHPASVTAAYPSQDG